MDNTRYVEKIAVLFGRIVTRMQADPELDGSGPTPSQVQGLGYLLHHGASPVGDIAQGLGISHPAAVKLIDRLRKKELVERTESETDRRVSLVELTPAGRELVGRILSRRTEILAGALGKLDAKQLEDVMRGLETLLAAALKEQHVAQSICLHCGDDHIGCCIVNRTHLELTGNTIDRV